MRAMLLAAALAIACTGERVESANPDAASPSDAGNDVGGDVGACGAVPGNLIPDGDFSMGFGAFSPGSCQLELATGPCGSALRVYDLMTPGRAVAQYGGVPIEKGTRLRLRAWFKKGKDTPPSSAPTVFIRSYSKNADGGEVTADYSVTGTLTDEWRPSERVFDLKDEQNGMEVMIDSYFAVDGKTHDFMVANISLAPADP